MGLVLWIPENQPAKDLQAVFHKKQQQQKQQQQQSRATSAVLHDFSSSHKLPAQQWCLTTGIMPTLPTPSPPVCCCWLLNVPQHASVSQGRICSDNFTCCHTEIEAADQTFCLTQSQYTHTGPTSPSADSITPGACQGSHWTANFEVTGMTRPRKILGASGIRTRDLPLSRRTP